MLAQANQSRAKIPTPDYQYYCNVVKPELIELDCKLYRTIINKEDGEQLKSVVFGIHERCNEAG